ncbi:hypothetical protein ACFLUQ_01875, partial [Chloroflexota bacterium]
WHFFIAMSFFSIGEAFRTGTHKAMIFTWLRIENRADDKTQVYGYTRSWSKIGSVVSTVLAVAMVFLTNNYSYVFLFTIIPYVAGFINLLYYPNELEGQPESESGVRDVCTHLWGCLRSSLMIKRLRRLIVESMSFEGVYKAAESYLQPVVKNMALLIPLFIGLTDIRRSSIMIGVIYVILYLGSAYASRNSHRLANFAGGEQGGSILLWKVVFILYLALIPLLFFKYYYIAVVGFVLLSLIQNFWRPMLISRFDDFASEKQGATILSIESQAKSVSTMLLAPVMGVAVDYLTGRNLGGEFWPVATIAAIIALYIIITAKRHDLSHIEDKHRK